ncbi:MAG: alpha/beta hydrolase [Planctomycetaceae bacterium]|nr:alpha/beta hydrolase [Planctomycetaceae bacterium]
MEEFLASPSLSPFGEGGTESRPQPAGSILAWFLWKILRFLFTVWIGVTLLFTSFQRSLIYQPRKGPVSTMDFGEHVERVSPIRVSTDDHLQLHGWHVLAPGTTVSPQRELVLYFPGNGGNREHRAEILTCFNRLGCDALLCDYRGYGENAGQPSEEAIAQDSLAIWTHAVEELEYAPDRIILCGESLGGGVATRLAWDLRQRGIDPAGLILKATFTSLVDTGAYLYPWLPVRTVLVDRYPSVDRIGGLACPVFVLHGQRDRIVPFELGRRLFDAAPESSTSGVKKSFRSFPGAGHEDVIFMTDPIVYDGFFEAIRAAR